MAQCPHANCIASCNDDMWSRIRAFDAGWFFNKHGRVQYCPAHVPDWVARWRQIRKRKEENNDTTQ